MDNAIACLNEALDLIYAIAYKDSSYEDTGCAYYDNFEDIAALIKAALEMLEKERSSE